MIISDLDYGDIEPVSEKNRIVVGMGSTWTETYTITSAGPGLGTADAGAVGVGPQSFAGTEISVTAYESHTTKGYKTESTYSTSAEAIAVAVAGNSHSVSVDISESSSEYYSHSIEVSTVEP